MSRLGRNFRQRQPVNQRKSPIQQAISVLRTLATILSSTPGSHWWDMQYTTSSPQLFQDAAGTQPVTAVEQYLGLCLDKPSGVVQYGPELVVNGDFSNGAVGWAVGAGWEISGGSANGAAGSGYLISSATVTAGLTYSVSWVNVGTSGLCRVFCGDVAVANIGDGGGVTRAVVKATATQAFKVWNFSSFVGTIDNISVREVIGTPLTQSTTTKRPQLLGTPALPKFDGADDAMTTGAITLGANMDCFMVVRRDSAEFKVLVKDPDPARVTNWYFGMVGGVGATTTAANIGATFTHAVNGVVKPDTRDALTAAMAVVSLCIYELRNADLSTWLSFSIANYPGYQFNGAIPEVILCPALSDADRTIVRTTLAAKYGITL